MKTVISQDNILQMMVSPDPEDAKIQFCDEHHDKLVEKLKLQGIDHLISPDLKTLKSTIAAGRLDPLWHSEEAIIKLCLRTIGSEGVVQFRCPVCAFQKHDFISQMALVMKKNLVGKPS